MTVDRNQKPQGVVIESFQSQSDAERALRALQDAGFDRDSISVVAQDKSRAQHVAEDTGTDTAEGAGIGAATGGVLGALGGLLVGATALTIPGIGIVVGGPIAAVLAGAGVGGVTGGLAGALAGLGVSRDEASQYQQRFEQGDIIVAVAAGSREDEARRILKGGGYDTTGTYAGENRGVRAEQRGTTTASATAYSADESQQRPVTPGSNEVTFTAES